MKQHHLSKIIGGFAIALSMTVFLSSRTTENLSDLVLSNIEAIADGEGEPTGEISCYASIEMGNPGARVIYCGSCTMEEGYKPTCVESKCLGSCTKAE